MTRGLFLHQDAVVRVAYSIHAWMLTNRSLGDTAQVAQDMASSSDSLIRDIGTALRDSQPVIVDRTVLAAVAQELSGNDVWQTPVGPGGQTTLGALIMAQLERHLTVVGPPQGTSQSRYLAAVAGIEQTRELARDAARDSLVRGLLPADPGRQVHISGGLARGAGLVKPSDLTYLALAQHAQATTGLDLEVVTENVPLALVAEAAGLNARAYRKPSRQDTVRERVDLGAERHERQRKKDQARERQPKVYSTSSRDT